MKFRVCCYKIEVCQCLFVLCHMLPVTADSSSLEVMIEVVNLNCQSDLVAGLADISDVVHIRSLLVMCKKA